MRWMFAAATALVFSAYATPLTAQSKCTASSEYRAMDFWIGTWDTAPWNSPAGTRNARNVIQPLLDGCLLLENYSGPGYEGKSFNFFDPNLKRWRQLWVDQNGIISDVVGGLRDGRIELIGEGYNPRGVKITRRMSLIPVSADTVHQIWEVSMDGGTTWTTVVDMRYTRVAT